MSTSPKATGFVSHGDCLLHVAGAGHPEQPARVRAITEALERSSLASELDRRTATEVERAAIEAVHDPRYIELVERTVRAGGGQLDADTYAGPGSDRAARLASGGLLQAVDRVMAGEWQNAFVAARPPGHHAERERAMGFCLYNHVAIAAAHLRTEHGLARVAILDWDVHHGNGTQHLFEADPSVFYASLHQFPHYPGTGAATERGVGEGTGATLNCPMESGTGDLEWQRAMEQRVLPALEAFAPEFILVSAGFDAHRADPLASCNLSADGFRELTRSVLALAASTANSRVVSLLEGGYDLEALAECALAHLEELYAAAR